MARPLVLVALGLAACTGTHLTSNQRRDATPEAPRSDATAGVETGRDAVLGPDQSPPVGDALATDETGCLPLEVTPLPEPASAACPATSATPACAAADTGAVIARSQACVDSWGAVQFQCMVWPPLPPGEEYLILQLQNCTDTVDIVSARACSDHIEVEYIGNGHCAACTGQRSDMRLFALPLDDRPVIASGYFIEPPCLPP